jgi:NADH:ubiquinone oxidoreductase subunit 6 (subunit J)
VLAALALLAAPGVGIALNEAARAGGIALFAVLAAVCIAAGAHLPRSPLPMAITTGGLALVLYALFVDYHAVVELTGFVLLAAGTAWDVVLRRRHQARVLGLES